MSYRRLRKEATDNAAAAASFQANDLGQVECLDSDLKYLGDNEPDARREIQLDFGTNDQ